MSKPKIIEFPRIMDQRGSLSYIENSFIPFEIKRVFYIYDVPTSENRGSHAHKNLSQLIIPLSGKLDVYLDNGVTKEIITLDRPWQGLYIPPMIWASQQNFASGAVCLALASDTYDESDYIRNYSDYLQVLNYQKNN
jgi:hypothetical protein